MRPQADHQCLVLGLGLRASASADTLQALWLQASQSLEQPARFCAVALPAHKAGHAALALWLAYYPDAALLAVDREALAAQQVPTQSPRMLAHYGCGSVAEAAALSAASTAAEARLLHTRLVAGDGSATLALALRRRRAGQPVQSFCCLARAASPSASLTFTSKE